MERLKLIERSPQTEGNRESKHERRERAYRDALGRFTKGHPGGPGNPYLKQLGEVKDAMHMAITPAAMFKLFQQMMECGIRGNVGAARFITERLLGKIDEYVDIEEPNPDDRFL